jgi:hypothetical protein
VSDNSPQKSLVARIEAVIDRWNRSPRSVRDRLTTPVTALSMDLAAHITRLKQLMKDVEKLERELGG